LKTKYFINKIIFSVFVLFVPSLVRIFNNLILKGDLDTSYSSLHGYGVEFLKLKLVILIMLISLRMYMNKKVKYSLIILSLLPVFWNSIIPAFLGGTILLLIYQLIRKESINKPVIITNLSSLFILIVFLFLNASNANLVLQYSLSDYALDVFVIAEYLKNVFLYITIFSLPLLLLLISKIRKYLDTFKLFIFFSLISSLISFSLIHDLYDAKQMVSNFFYPTLMVSIIIIFIWLFNKFPRIINIISFLSIFFILTHSYAYHKKYKKNYPIPEVFKTDKNVLVATDINLQKRGPVGTTYFFNLYQRPYANEIINYKYWLPIRIDIFDKAQFNSNKAKFEFTHMAINQAFLRFVSKKTKEIDKSKIASYKIEFLKKFNFRYLLVPKDQFENNSLRYVKNLNIVNKVLFDKNVLLLELKLD
jgi:hypothetical protein